MKMKLTRIVYLNETFHLTEDFAASFRAWQGVVLKPPKKVQKSGFGAYFLEIFNTIPKTVTHVT